MSKPNRCFTEAMKEIMSHPDIPLPPKAELHQMLCGCGAAMGTDGHADVYEKGGVIYLATVRCAGCEAALGNH